jgi:hypothetical protein
MTTAQRLYQGLGFRPEPADDWSPVAGIRLLGYLLDL